MNINEEKLEEYRVVKANLDKYKEMEIKMRNEICAELLKGKRVGAHSYDDFEGFKVKATKKVTHKLDQDGIQDLVDNDAVTEETWDLLNIKYALKLAEYKKTSSEESEQIDEFVTVVPAQATLEVILGE